MAHYTSVQDGQWNNPATWGVGSGYPGTAAGDTADVFHTVTMALTSESQQPYPVGYTFIDAPSDFSSWGYLVFQCTYEPTHAHFNGGLKAGENGGFDLRLDAPDQHYRLMLDPPATGHALDLGSSWNWTIATWDNTRQSDIVIYLNNTATRDCGILMNSGSQISGYTMGSTLTLLDTVAAGATTVRVGKIDGITWMSEPKVGDYISVGPLGSGSSPEVLKVTSVVSVVRDGSNYVTSATLGVQRYAGGSGSVYPHAAGAVVQALSSCIAIVGRTDQPTNTYLTSNIEDGPDVRSIEFRNFGSYWDNQNTNGFTIECSGEWGGTFPQACSFWQTPGTHQYPRKFVGDIETPGPTTLQSNAFYNASSAGGSVIATRRKYNGRLMFQANSFMACGAPVLGGAVQQTAGVRFKQCWFVGTPDSGDPTQPNTDSSRNSVYSVNGPQSSRIAFDRCEFYFLKCIANNIVASTKVMIDDSVIGYKNGSVSRVAQIADVISGTCVATRCILDPSRTPDSYKPSTQQFPVFSIVGSNLTPDTAMVVGTAILSRGTDDGEPVLVITPADAGSNSPAFMLGNSDIGLEIFAFPACAGDVVTITLTARMQGVVSGGAAYWSNGLSVTVYGPKLGTSPYVYVQFEKTDGANMLNYRTLSRTFTAAETGMHYMTLSLYTNNGGGILAPNMLMKYPRIQGNTYGPGYLSSVANFPGYPQFGFPLGRPAQVKM